MLRLERKAAVSRPSLSEIRGGGIAYSWPGLGGVRSPCRCDGVLENGRVHLGWYLMRCKGIVWFRKLDRCRWQMVGRETVLRGSVIGACTAHDLPSRIIAVLDAMISVFDRRIDEGCGQ